MRAASPAACPRWYTHCLSPTHCLVYYVIGMATSFASSSAMAMGCVLFGTEEWCLTVGDVLDEPHSWLQSW